MKKIYLLFCLTLPVYLPAQKKVDLDRFNISVKVLSLPQMRLDSSLNTFSVSTEGTKLTEPLLNEMNPEASVQIKGLKKVPGNAHIHIKVKLGDLLPENFTIRQRTESIRGLGGAITGSRTLYHEEVTYTFAATATVTDHRGMHITDLVLADRGYKQVYNGPAFPIRKLAEGYFLVNSLAITKELYQSCVTRAMRFLGELGTRNFGFEEVATSDYLWVVGSRKHPEYEASRKAVAQLNEVLFSMNAFTPLSNEREKLKPVIEYFESIKTSYPTTSKHDRKMRYASYFNLAIMYFYLDDPQAMMKEASGLVLNDYDTRDGKMLEEAANRLRNQFERANIYTRHMAINDRDL